MRISPRYDSEPIVELDGLADAIAAPLLRQRRRFAAIVARLTPQQWETPSRCDTWRVKDVVAHMRGTDQFWRASIAAGLGGAPTRFLDGFDPKATPAALVDAVRDEPVESALAGYLQANGNLCATVESLDGDNWSVLAESPPGHVTLSTLAHHALWDAWVHERDVLLPLGMTQDEEPDEVIASLRYVAALSSMFALQHSTTPRTEALVIEAADPEARFAVVVDERVRVIDVDAADETAVALRGRAVELLEAFSVRAPFPEAVPEEATWLVTGLADVFETVPY